MYFRLLLSFDLSLNGEPSQYRREQRYGSSNNASRKSNGRQDSERRHSRDR
jgi:hypothetical protein